MKHDALAIDQALASLIGDDAALVGELRQVFAESAVRHALALAAAQEKAAWCAAAWRLKGCAASFGATDLMAAAQQAADSPRADPLALKAVADAIAALAQ